MHILVGRIKSKYTPIIGVQEVEVVIKLKDTHEVYIL